MLFFGHPFIASAHFYHIYDVESIAKTPSNALLFVVFDEKNLDLIAYMRENRLHFALEVASLKEALFAEQLGARYIITDESLVKSVQSAAEHYLFDAKILCRIHEEEMIERCAKEGIDGVIYAEAIIRV